jgi:MFS family permease
VQRHGSRSNLLGASLLRFLALTVVLTVPVLAETTLYTDRFDTPWQATLVFTGAFALLGISAHAQAIGGQRYITDVVAAADRHATTVLANLVLAITACAPLLGAFLIEQYDLKTAITVALVLAFTGFAANGLLYDPSPRPVRRQGAWRHRRATRRTA